MPAALPDGLKNFIYSNGHKKSRAQLGPAIILIPKDELY